MESSELQQLIERDSPDLIELTIGYSECDPCLVPAHGGWNSSGHLIGRNTHLKEVCFELSHLATQPSDSKQFLNGISYNRSIQKLCIYGDSPIICDGDVFDILTPFFVNNRELKFLTIGELGRKSLTPPGHQKLVSALGKFNRLREFEFAGSVFAPKEVFKALHGHQFLEKLGLRGIKIQEDRFGCEAFSSLLQKSDSMIKSVNLNCSIIDDDAIHHISSGLAGSRSLKKVHLKNAGISDCGWQALFTDLQNPSCNLEELELSRRSRLSDATLGSLVVALPNHSNLKSLQLRDSLDISINGWRVLCRFLGSQDNKLEELDLSENELDDDDALAHLGTSLTHCNTLKCLKLKSINDYYDNFTAIGCNFLFRFLGSQGIGLEELHLGRNRFDRGDIAFLGASLAQNSTLKILNLSCTSSNWEEHRSIISSMLANPDSALELLDLSENNFNLDDKRNETLMSLASALEYNTSLKELILTEYYEDSADDVQSITSQTWGALSTVLCNTSSIMATYASNHTLKKLELMDIPDEISSLLELNRKDKHEAARLKIIDSHFSGIINVHPFVEMDPKLLPQAIAWMGRSGSNNDLNGMYQIVEYTMSRVE